MPYQIYDSFKNRIKSIKIYALSDVEFTALSNVQYFLNNHLAHTNIFEYKAISIQDKDLPAMVLFRYNGMLVGAGICIERLKFQNSMNGYNGVMFFEAGSIYTFKMPLDPGMIRGLDPANGRVVSSCNLSAYDELIDKVKADYNTFYLLGPELKGKINDILAFAEGEFGPHMTQALKKPIVKLSPEITNRHYGLYEKQDLISRCREIKDSLRNDPRGDLLEIADRLLELLNKSQKEVEPSLEEESNDEEDIRSLERELRERLRSLDNSPKAQQLKDLFDDAHYMAYSSIMLGAYDSAGNTITIYYNAILRCSRSLDYFKDYCVAVLAHEFFHAMHYHNVFHSVGRAAYWAGHMPFSSKYEEEMVSPVKESLAEYFEYCWCDCNSSNMNYNDIKNRTRRGLSKQLFPGWPYSGALALIKHAAQGCYASYEFGTIYHNSLFVWWRAYDFLEKLYINM